jgi:UPF0755 protein
MNDNSLQSEGLETALDTDRSPWFWLKLVVATLCAVFFIVLAYLLFLNTPPSGFVLNTAIKVEPGLGVRDITARLEEAKVVRSKDFLYLVVAFLYEPKNIKASTYVFSEPLTTIQVAERLTLGDFDNNLIRFTHIEGERARTIARNAGSVLPNFDETAFLEAAEQHEGKLFPDTYFIPDTFTADQLLQLMLNTFNNTLLPYEEKILSSSLSLDEIVILASIVEREANSTESMKMVSAILQNRLQTDMPLQADASIEYVLSKPLEELLPEDLRVESPYNTYLNIGLPPTPIGNPGLTSIEAVLEPAETDYLFYLTDSDGVFHYARTYQEHLTNIELYLR